MSEPVGRKPVERVDVEVYLKSVALSDFEATGWGTLPLGRDIYAFIDPKKGKATIYRRGNGEVGSYDYRAGTFELDEKKAPLGLFDLSFRSTHSLGVREEMPKRPSTPLDRDLV